MGFDLIYFDWSPSSGEIYGTSYFDDMRPNTWINSKFQCDHFLQVYIYIG